MISIFNKFLTYNLIKRRVGNILPLIFFTSKIKYLGKKLMNEVGSVGVNVPSGVGEKLIEKANNKIMKKNM